MAYLNTAQVAALANLSPRTIAYEVTRGHLRRTTIGRSVRFAESDVADWLRNCRVSA